MQGCTRLTFRAQPCASAIELAMKTETSGAIANRTSGTRTSAYQMNGNRFFRTVVGSGGIVAFTVEGEHTSR